ncbi:hypothetical protein X777_12539 [Ooceraea biroi]|uniref:Uncharacterized protein n=1 Tax=Ooceraea biroi TaxID=2015173 RepID=A0A026W0M4_OOCBI|nr:hypothetical protein X777_12539 [Ooceraea biroi]
MFDTSVLQHQGPLISSGAIIGIVLATIFIIFIIIDAICCCVRKTGIIYYACERSRRKPVDEEDAKLGSLPHLVTYVLYIVLWQV